MLVVHEVIYMIRGTWNLQQHEATLQEPVPSLLGWPVPADSAKHAQQESGHRPGQRQHVAGSPVPAAPQSAGKKEV